MAQLLTLADLSHLAARKLPDTPDGRYPYQVQPKAKLDIAQNRLMSTFRTIYFRSGKYVFPIR